MGAQCCTQARKPPSTARGDQPWAFGENCCAKDRRKVSQVSFSQDDAANACLEVNGLPCGAEEERSQALTASQKLEILRRASRGGRRGGQPGQRPPGVDRHELLGGARSSEPGHASVVCAAVDATADYAATADSTAGAMADATSPRGCNAEFGGGDLVIIGSEGPILSGASPRRPEEPKESKEFEEHCDERDGQQEQSDDISSSQCSPRSSAPTSARSRLGWTPEKFSAAAQFSSPSAVPPLVLPVPSSSLSHSSSGQLPLASPASLVSRKFSGSMQRSASGPLLPPRSPATLDSRRSSGGLQRMMPPMYAGEATQPLRWSIRLTQEVRSEPPTSQTEPHSELPDQFPMRKFTRTEPLVASPRAADFQQHAIGGGASSGEEDEEHRVVPGAFFSAFEDPGPAKLEDISSLERVEKLDWSEVRSDEKVFSPAVKP